MIIEFKPIKVGEKTFDKITLKEPTLAQVLDSMSDNIEFGEATEDHTGFVMGLIQRVSEVHPNLIDELPISVIRKASKYLQTFPLFLPLEVEKGKKYEDGHMLPIVGCDIEKDGKKISAMYLREPKGSEIRIADRETKSGLTLTTLSKRNIILLSMITGIAPDELKKLPISQFREAEKIVGFFTTNTP